MSKFANLDVQQQAIARNVKADFTSNDEMRTKNASMATTDYLRLRLREDSVCRKIITPKTVSESDLDRRVEDDWPASIIDIEGQSAGAMTVPFGSLPPSAVIKANRFMVVYQKLTSHRYEMDTTRLMTWNMDIRDMFYDLILKDIMDEEDTKFFSVVKAITGDYATNEEYENKVLGGVANEDLKNNGTYPGVKGYKYEDTGAARWMNCGAFSRDAFAFFSKALMSNAYKLNPGMYLMNTVTAQDFIKFDRNEAGGDFAQNSLFGSVTVDTVDKNKLVTTTKSDLVPDDDVFQFAPEEYLGVFYILKDVTMITDLKEDSLLNFSAYEYVGAAIENVAAIARGTFRGPVYGTWRTGYDSGDSDSGTGVK